MKTARFLRNHAVAVRADDETKLRTIAGYGAVFYAAGDAGTEYPLWDDMVERIMPGAFDRALREDDVRSLFNHNPDLVLGRNTAGTLRLSIDAVGLRYEVDPPAGRGDVVDSVQRGDVDGSSFMFEVLEVVWREVEKLLIREIHQVRLWEVGPVVFPAYESTTAGLRQRYRAHVAEERAARKGGGARSAAARGGEIAKRARAVQVRERSRRAG